MHVAILDEELPFPLTSGKRIRTYGLVSRLARRHRITWICHRGANDVESAAGRAEFARLGIAVREVDHRVPAQRGGAFYGRLAGNLLSPLPYSASVHASPALTDAVRSLEAADPPDLWQAEWTPYAHSLRNVRGPWAVMAHNVETVIWRRLAATEPSLLKRAYIAEQARKYARFERWACSAARRVIAVSDEDAARFHGEFAAERVAVVDNGVDTAYFTPGEPAEREPRTALFLGSLDWRPNLDGVALLLGRIIPEVLREEPAARFQIVGRNPPAWLRERASRTPGVELHADVPDVRPFLRRAGLLAVPLRVGGGSRLKILEALATATPVVSTAVGAEGLRLCDGDHLTLAEPEQFASALVETMRRPAIAQAERGRARVLAQYDWQPLADRLAEIWELCATRQRQAA